MRYHISATYALVQGSLGVNATATTATISFDDNNFQPEDFKGSAGFVGAGAALMGGASASIVHFGDAYKADWGWEIGFDFSAGTGAGYCISIYINEQDPCGSSK